MPLKVIIADDELLAREMLSYMINSFDLDIKIVSSCQDLPEAVKAIHLYKPDLVFLDVEMPRFKGIEINQFIPNIDFDIIFTTAHQQFAIDAIKIGATDYLLKPIEVDELKKGLIKSIDKKRLEKNGNKQHNRLIVNTISQIYVVDYNNIIYYKAEGAYSKIITTEGEITASKNLKHYEELLKDNSMFIRIHKSFIVNKTKIKSINKLKQLATVENGDNISVSLDKMDKILDF